MINEKNIHQIAMDICKTNKLVSTDTSGFRYKIGELVELSAAGRKAKQNDRVYGMIGMVMGYEKNPINGNWDKYPYKIHWFGFTQGDGTFPMKEYEIKRVRADAS